MAVLNKIRSATLLEALVATILVVGIFVISSLVLNNVLLNTFSKKTHKAVYRMNELEYSMQQSAIRLPHQETYEEWDINISKDASLKNEVVIFTATNTKSGKTLIRKRIYAK